MKALRIFTGFLFLTTAVAGDATGKVGKNGFGAVEWSSKVSKNVSHFVSDTSRGVADSWTTNGLTDNSPAMQNITDWTYIISDFSHSAGDFYKGTEGTFKQGRQVSESLESRAQGWNKKGTNLIRDHQYRDLKEKDIEFGYQSSRVASKLDNKDWVLVNEEPETFFDTVEHQD
jgi:hypothetical protein